MIIRDLSESITAGRKRISATFEWEDQPADSFEGFLESEAVDGFGLDENTFLIAGWIPALRSGERRIKIEGAVSATLTHGLKVVERTLRSWYPEAYPPASSPAIEARFEEKSPPTGRAAGFMFSGGVDSLSTLRANHLHFPAGHPSRFTEGVVIHGFQPEVDAIRPSVDKSLTALAESAEISIRSVTTNLRLIRDDWAFWVNEFAGSFLAAVSHSLSGSLHTAVIPPSTDFAWGLEPEGTHPLLDNWFSSLHFNVRHDDVTRDRFERTRLISDWNAAMENLRVCNHPEAASSWTNCGHCDKCLMTMLPLLALGRLEACRTFPAKDIQASQLRSHLRINWLNHAYFAPLIAPLNAAGRTDLAKVLDELLDDYHDDVEWRQRKALFRKKLSDLDQALLKGRARKFLARSR